MERSSEQCTAVYVFINFFRNFQNNYKKQIHSVVFVNLYWLIHFSGFKLVIRGSILSFHGPL